ncbi:MAG TPA: LysR family transcriptional regulator [Hyphomicrobiaceae bacterium]|nr:LysR family transcriptional regulator [Hyphomicrobiaceae bacterium]
MPARRLPPLHAVRAFEAAARHLSMTDAAAELNVTPGAISRHVRALEAEMQTPLFLRRSTGLVLTSAGEALADVARDALDGLANAVSGLRLRRFRRLSVGAYGFFISRAVLPHWRELMAGHPELEIDLHVSSNALDLVPGRHDAVIAVSDGTPRPGSITHRLMPIATVPVCAPSWLREGRADFASLPLLHARPRPEDWRRWLDFAGYGFVSAQSDSSFESVGLALEAASAGMGSAMAIEGLLAADLTLLNLVRADNRARPTRRVACHV